MKTQPKDIQDIYTPTTKTMTKKLPLMHTLVQYILEKVKPQSKLEILIDPNQEQIQIILRDLLTPAQVDDILLRYPIGINPYDYQHDLFAHEERFIIY